MLHWFLLDLAFFINIIIHLILCFAFCWAAVDLLPSLDVVGYRPLGTGSFTMLLNKHKVLLYLQNRVATARPSFVSICFF